jgi:hypothetical protein
MTLARGAVRLPSLRSCCAGVIARSVAAGTAVRRRRWLLVVRVSDLVPWTRRSCAAEYEDMYPNPENCPETAAAETAAANSPDMQKVIETFTPVLKTVSQIVGKTYTTDDSSIFTLFVRIDMPVCELVRVWCASLCVRACVRACVRVCVRA